MSQTKMISATIEMRQPGQASQESTEEEEAAQRKLAKHGASRLEALMNPL
jgi:hypothetical protein